MQALQFVQHMSRSLSGRALAVGILGAVFILPGAVQGAEKKQQRKAPSREISRPVAPPAPKTSLLAAEAWQRAPLAAVKPEEIDQLVTEELKAGKIEPAALTTDEQFIRRVTLDLTGTLPVPADVKEFVSDSDPKKRAKLIDKLLATDEYAEHWARYWKDVVSAPLTDLRGRALANAFQKWMQEQLKTNQSWDKIARAMIAAEGSCNFDDEGKNGALFFLASHRGNDAANECASETSRVFLGIQIQCAQCHDHPSDQWKRVQFHQLAAYFSRIRERPVRGQNNRPAGIQLVSLPRGEHQMPDKEDPKRSYLTHPRFLDGKGPGENLADLERRKSLANAITDKRNYWFAAAYVNRIWGDLMGQSFYQPVDDMGPKKEAVFPGVLTRLTGAFRGTNYDIKAMFRTIMNSQTYQRQIRLGDSADQHLHFAAAYPTRLRADALWDSLVGVLGTLGNPIDQTRVRPMGPFQMARGLEGQFKEEFGFDPSLKSDEIEGSIPQALLMMNNPVIQQRVRATGTNLLARILKAYPQDDDAVKMVYLRTLARKPTDRELDKCRKYLKESSSRAEAFEDLLWALINSTEFQTKR